MANGTSCAQCGHPDHNHAVGRCYWRNHGTLVACACPAFVTPSAQDELRERNERLVAELARGQSDLGDARAEIVQLLAAIEAHYQATFGHSACFERDEALWAELTRRDGRVRMWARQSLPPEQEHELACTLYRRSLFKEQGS